MFEGGPVEVTALEGSRVTLRVGPNSWRTVSLTALVADLGARREVVGEPDALVPRLTGLTAAQRTAVKQKADHVREVMTGYRSGDEATARPGEPQAEYEPTRSLTARYAAKAAEIGVTQRTVERWVRAYRREHEAGLAENRGRRTRLDPRWEAMCRQVLAENVKASTMTDSARLLLVEQRLIEQYGLGEVRIPSTATAYRHLARIAKGTGARFGSAKGRRSIADRPAGMYGRLRASGPGEYVVLDTQSLDVFAMEPVTLRWLPAQLTVALDLFSRCVLAVRVTPVSTKAVDVAGLLYEALTPKTAPPEWPQQACWPYHGIPLHLVHTEITEDERPAGVPVCPPETLVIDHGKAFLSEHVLSVCTRLGISIQPARPKTPTDKPTVERFFRTLREGLIQYLPGYKGPDVYSRGENVEDTAFFYLHELEDVIREWIAMVYHRRRHSGLVIADWPHTSLLPNEMYELGVATCGLLRLPRSPGLVYDFLPSVWCTIQHYGVDVDGNRYNGDVLEPYRDTESPYRGRYPGKWPVRYNPEDVRTAYFQDPADHRWYPLTWEHAAALGAPMSAEAAAYARRLALREGRWSDPVRDLADLLARWNMGMVADRRERRMAARLAAERAALPSIDTDQEMVATLPTAARIAGLPEHAAADLPEITGDDDALDWDEQGSDGEFYADAFEVLE
ncbi:MAG TPA: Mu transposase C-terminal domain-containing protein [Actinocrinis sp.]|nr:Mu transposase C-terminal domain-containing protein [Actinocrinis sp.]